MLHLIAQGCSNNNGRSSTAIAFRTDQNSVQGEIKCQDFRMSGHAKEYNRVIKWPHNFLSNEYGRSDQSIAERLRSTSHGPDLLDPIENLEFHYPELTGQFIAIPPNATCERKLFRGWDVGFACLLVWATSCCVKYALLLESSMRRVTSWDRFYWSRRSSPLRSCNSDIWKQASVVTGLDELQSKNHVWQAEPLDTARFLRSWSSSDLLRTFQPLMRFSSQVWGGDTL